MLCGAHSEAFIIHNGHKVSVMGVHFKPGGSAAFFPLPAGELHNQIISLNELWHRRRTTRLLAKTPALEPRLVLERFLLTIMQPLKRHAVVDFACVSLGIAEGGNAARTPIPTVGTVTDQIGFSTRHFNQLFRDQVGLTQNCFVAFDACKSLICWLAKRRWIGQILLSLAATDQAHLIHDFRAFADCTPTEYLAQRGFHPCHVVLPD